MADNKAASVAKQIRCKVVSRYAGKDVGMVVTVEEKEYNRLREPIMTEDGRQVGYRFPVLISEADETAQLKTEQADREALMRRQQEHADHGAGWAEMERQSLEAQRLAFAKNTKARQEAEAEMAKSA